MLGPGGFEEISGEVRTTTLIVFAGGRTHSHMSGVDVQAASGAVQKAKALIVEPIRTAPQDLQLRNPDGRIIVEHSSWDGLLELHCSSFLGTSEREISQPSAATFGNWQCSCPGWAWHQMAVESPCLWAGRSYVVAWDWKTAGSEGFQRRIESKSTIKTRAGVKRGVKHGVAVNLSSDLNATVFSGETYEKAVAALIPKERGILPALWCFVRDSPYSRAKWHGLTQDPLLQMEPY